MTGAAARCSRSPSPATSPPGRSGRGRCTRSPSGSGSPSRSRSCWVRLSAQPMRLRRETAAARTFEGEVVPVRLAIEPSTRVLPPGRSSSRSASAGSARARRRSTAPCAAAYLLDAVPRGRYPFERSRALIGDPFGLAARRSSCRRRARCSSGRASSRSAGSSPTPASTRRRCAPARAAAGGPDVHGVREWVEGESLRHVHWGSTAKTGRLMVKEVEDTPRDEVAILLDARSGAPRRRCSTCRFARRRRCCARTPRGTARRGCSSTRGGSSRTRCGRSARTGRRRSTSSPASRRTAGRRSRRCSPRTEPGSARSSSSS